MKSYVKIELTNPCTEDWNAMHPTTGGRFCDSCTKHVVDFSGMNDEQIARYFIDNPGSTCGRYTESQLSRNLYIEPKVEPSQAKAINWMLRAAMLAGITLPAKALATKPVIESIANATAKPVDDPNTREIKVSGTVKDNETGNPIAYAVVTFDDKGKVVADSLGNFKGTLHVLGGPETELKILVTASFYTQQALSFALPEKGQVIADIRLERVVMSGNMVYGLAGKRTVYETTTYFNYRDSAYVEVAGCPDIGRVYPDYNNEYRIFFADSLVGQTLTLLYRDKDENVVAEKSVYITGQPLRCDLIVTKIGVPIYLDGSYSTISFSRGIGFALPFISMSAYTSKTDGVSDGLTISAGIPIAKLYTPIFRSKWFSRK